MKKILSILLTILTLVTTFIAFTSAITVTPEDQIVEIYNELYEDYVYMDFLDQNKTHRPIATMSDFYNNIARGEKSFLSGSHKLSALFIYRLKEKLNVENATYIFVNRPGFSKYFAVVYKLLDNDTIYVADPAAFILSRVLMEGNRLEKPHIIDLETYCNTIVQNLPGTTFQILNQPPYEIHKLEKDLVKGEDYTVYRPEV